MSLIEQAAKRLEQLRQAGVELPEDAVARDQPSPSPAQKATERENPRQTSRPSQITPLPVGKDSTAASFVSSANRVNLDFDAIASSGLLVPSQSRNQLANEFRVIKRPLIANAMGKGATPVSNGNLIMVTSALPGEGKSFTAVNLAISIAMELDNTVMLVDADVARPSVLRHAWATSDRRLPRCGQGEFP